MEGERILRALKENGDLNEILSDIRDYLYPLQVCERKRKGAKKSTDVTKYQLFAMKVLKLIIQQLSLTTDNDQHLLNVANTCMNLLQPSLDHYPLDCSKLGAFSYEKLLIHLANQSIRLLAIETILNCFHGVHKTMIKALKSNLDRHELVEAEGLIKGMSDILWKAAIKVDSDTSGCKSVSIGSFKLRQLSIEILLLLQSQLLVGLDRAIKTDNQLLKVEGSNEKNWKALWEFHEHIFISENLSITLSQGTISCQMFSQVLEWLIQVAKSSIKLKDMPNSKGCIERIKRIIKIHYMKCTDKNHTSHELLAVLIELSVNCWFPLQSSFTRFFKKSCSLLPLINLTSLSPLLISLLSENIEFFLTVLKSVQKLDQNINVILSKVFQYLHSLSLFYNEGIETLMERQHKETPTNVIMVVGKQRQLSVMNVLMEISLDILVHCGSNISQDESVISKCLPIVQKSCNILESCSLPVEEYYWVGVNAYNLGLIHYQMNYIELAVPLLQSACAQLSYYSQNKKDIGTNEVKLFKKYGLLLECLIKLEQCNIAIETLVKAMMSQTANNETADQKQVSILISQFVRIKCLMKIKNYNEDVLIKTSADYLTGCHDTNLKFLYLQEELKAYESMRQDTREWQLVVTKQLIFNCRKNSHYHAWLLIKQASLHHSLHKDHLYLLSEAIEILKLFDQKKLITSKCMTLDLLGLAYLWKGICYHASIVSESIESTKSNQEFIQFLCDAIHYWCEVWQNISHANISSSCHKECFLDLSSTLHHLFLCISFANSLLLPNLALKLLDVLISLSAWSKECDSLILDHAIAMKTQILLTEYGIESITDDHLILLNKAEVELMEGKEKECVAQLKLKLSLATVHIQTGKMDDSLTILAQILSHPVLSTQSSCIHSLLASVATVGSYYLQCLGKAPLPVNEFLTHLMTSKYNGCDIKYCPCKETMGLTTDVSFKLTDLEMALDSVKLIRGLAYSLLSKHTQTSHSVQVNEAIPVQDQPHSFDVMLSTPAYKTWEIISCLLESLLKVAQLYSAQGMIKESEHYTNEGLYLAKSLHLMLWYVEFLLQLAKLQELTADKSVLNSITEAAHILDMEDLITGFIDDTNDVSSSLVTSMKYLSISTNEMSSIDHNHHQYILSISLLHITCQYLLSTSAPFKALKLLKLVDKLLCMPHKRDSSQKSSSSYNEVMLPYIVNNLQLNVKGLVEINRFEEAIEVANNELLTNDYIQLYCHLPTLKLSLAKLHYFVSKAILHSIEKTELAADIWEGVGYTLTDTVSKHRKTRRTRRVLSDSDEESTLLEMLPTQLQAILSHLFLSCQYVTPVTLCTYFGRDVFQLLGIVLSVWQNNLASHFLLLSSSISLNQESVFWFGRKLRKGSDERSFQTILNDIMLTFKSSVSPSLLAKSRILLHPLPHVLPLQYTQQMVSRLPSDWVYCSLSLIQRTKTVKVLVIVRVKNDKENVIVKIQIPEDNKDTLTNELLTEFSQVMTESVASTSLTEKRQWWTARRDLDKQLKDLLSRIQTIWLREWRILLLPNSLTFPSSSVLLSFLQQHGVHGSETWAEILVGGAQELSLQELKLVLVRLLRKRDSILIAKIVHAIENIKTTPAPPNSLILSLSQPLHNFPIESIPILRDQLVTRIPSLIFLSAHLVLQQTSGCTHIDPTHTYYIINPSGDLKNTQKKFASWFEKEAGWKGVVGRPPSKDEFVHGLKYHDTFIYCGHGKAREYLGRDQRLQELQTHATVLQMGCSSGKLQTLGSHLDPHGMALNFLIAGCPFLVANLWDVTDQDIDRFCTTLVKNWLTVPDSLKRTHDELLHNVIEARESCKLKYLIGASPVVYGLPVYRN